MYNYTSNVPGTLVLNEKQCFQWLPKTTVFSVASQLVWKWVPDDWSGDRKCAMAEVLRWWHGTPSWRRCAERSLWRLAMSETTMQQSARHFGSLSCRHRWTITASSYQTQSATSSQCKSACRICDSPWSYLCVPLTKRAAAFSTRCSLSVTDLGAPASIMLQ